jgi:hypothetical protein
VLTGDVIIHLEINSDPSAVKFSSIVSTCGFSQHVTGSTHKAGHLLDVILTRSETDVTEVIVWPPVLSDHSRIMCKLGFRRTQHYETVTRLRRCRRSMDFDAFLCDLSHSSLLCSPPSDFNELFACYEETLRSLVDRHAPLCQRRLSTRHFQPWCDADCRVARRKSRRLERVYR